MADIKISALPVATTPLAGTEVLPIVQGGTTDKVSVADLTAGRAVGVKSLTVSDTNPRINYMPTTPFIGYCLTDYSSGVGSFYVGTENSTGSALGAGAYARVLWGNGNYPIVVATNNVARLTVSGAGDATFNTGNLIQGTAAKGVNFTANANAAGMTSELLNWYEEGTFTPTLLSGGAQVGRTYSVQSARYTRIGNRVLFNIYITLSAKGTSTGVTQIGGLPFTSGSDAEGAASVTIRNVTYSGQIGTFIAASNTLINIYDMTSGNPFTLLPDTGLSNTSLFVISGQYKV